MAASTFNNTRRFAISEPLRAAWEHANQFFVTSAAAYMSAAFSMQHTILPWWIAVPLAIGFEWTYLRGLANADKTGKTRWAPALNWAAMLTSIVYGVLYILGVFMVIPANPAGWVAVLLALSHVIPMAVLSFCGANLRRVQKLEEVARNQKLVAVEDERNQRELDATTELRLEMARKEAELELWQKAQLAKAQLKQEVARNHTATTPQPAVQPKVKSEIVYNGVTYPTVQAAAEAHGISRQAMAKRLAKEAT